MNFSDRQKTGRCFHIKLPCELMYLCFKQELGLRDRAFTGKNTCVFAWIGLQEWLQDEYGFAERLSLGMQMRRVTALAWIPQRQHHHRNMVDRQIEGFNYGLGVEAAYSSYERGSNENQNRMIRRRHPKGTDFGTVTDEEIKETESWMNNYPRKILGWKTSAQLFKECLAAL